MKRLRLSRRVTKSPLNFALVLSAAFIPVKEPMDDEIYRGIRDEFTDNFDEEMELQLGELSEEASGDRPEGAHLTDFRRHYLRGLLRL